MKDHKYYLEKADGVLADLTAASTELLPEQAKKFIRLMIKKAKVARISNIPTMKRAKQDISTIRFGSRIMRPATEAAALAAAKRVTPDMATASLSVKEIIAETRFSYTVVEDNIEKGQYKNTVMQAFAAAGARDVDELVIQGDTASADDYLALLDGIIKQATTNVYTKTPKGRLAASDFVQMLRTMPEEFREDEEQLRFLTSVGAVDDYRETRAARQTPDGDSNQETQRLLKPQSIPLLPIPLFPKAEGAGTDETRLMLFHPKNNNIGMYRTVTIETDKDIKTRQHIVVMTMRLDTIFTHEPAVVRGDGILS